MFLDLQHFNHVITQALFKDDKRKIGGLTNWQAPETVRDVQSFLCIDNYYRTFMKDFARVRTSITELRKEQILVERDRTNRF